MSGAYYNEIDPYAAQWLRNLIAAGHIAPGDVDERSIEDVRPDDLRNYAQCHFFAGIGVWSHSLRRAGWDDARPVWTGSCPCQPFSQANEGGGFADERHLWPAWHHLISECRPSVVFGEQVASADGLGWLDLVQTDMEGTGYACAPVDFCAAGVGAPHIRQRLWFVAHPAHNRLEGRQRQNGQPISGGVGKSRMDIIGTVENAGGLRVDGFWRNADWLNYPDGKRRPVEPGALPMAHGIAARVGRLRAYGNAINAEAATAIIRAANGCLTESA